MLGSQLYILISVFVITLESKRNLNISHGQFSSSKFSQLFYFYYFKHTIAIPDIPVQFITKSQMQMVHIRIGHVLR